MQKAAVLAAFYFSRKIKTRHGSHGCFAHGLPRIS